jgi:hypothetical protein
MRSGGEQFHHHGDNSRQKLQDQLRIQTGALRDLRDDSIEPVLAEQIDDVLNPGVGLGQIGNGLLNRGLTVVLVLFVEGILEVRTKNAQNRL